VVKAGLKAGISDSVRTGGNLLGGGLDFTLGSRSINNIIDRIGLNNVFNLGQVTPNFYMQLQAIENRQNVEMRQTPKLSTLNGHAATLSIGNTRYYSVTTQNLMGSLSPSTVTTQQFYPIEANLALRITPFVSADEDVTLSMEMDISNFTENTKINEPPPTATSKFKSIIRVKNEDMVLLGGIERTEKGDSYEGVPLLGRIPVLKWLFSSRDRRNIKVVSVVFIKPTIIYN
jgi:type IV pilus assembly protein PilQ